MYYLLFAFFYLLSLLPFRVLYLLSDCIAFLLGTVFKYRKAVLDKNLLIAFPEKTAEEREKIKKEFYTNFTDNFIELIKLMTISRAELNKRYVGNYEVINDLYESGQSVQVHLGHFFNWEMANLANAINLRYPLLVVYMPVTNKQFDRLLLYIRTRFGSKLISAADFKNQFMKNKGKQYCLALVADQSPAGPEGGFWVPFFNKYTPILKGPERGAQLNKTAIVMTKISKVKRGYYRSENVLYTTQPRQLPDGEITNAMLRFIEESLREQPANYLWSHNRWKHDYDAYLASQKNNCFTVLAVSLYTVGNIAAPFGSS
jgi:KDO2-lipid IV(A) lauroyltransferase